MVHFQHFKATLVVMAFLAHATGYEPKHLLRLTPSVGFL